MAKSVFGCLYLEALIVSSEKAAYVNMRNSSDWAQIFSLNITDRVVGHPKVMCASNGYKNHLVLEDFQAF